MNFLNFLGSSQAILHIYIDFYHSLADLVRSSLGSAFAFDNTVLTKMVESGMHALRPEIEFLSFSSSRKTEEEQLDFLEINQPHHDPGTHIYFSN